MQKKSSRNEDTTVQAMTLGMESVYAESIATEHGVPLTLPMEFGRYRLLKLLGKGGMGTVYLAHDSELDREVALKIPQLAVVQSKDQFDRFRREARLAATLDHHNICQIYDIGEHQQYLFLTMALVEGMSLEAIMSKGAIPPRIAVGLIWRIANTVQFAHEWGIIHRDLKPANIMIKRDRDFVIMDFGLAQQVDEEEAHFTATGAVIGTVAYMAPEQLRGEKNATGPQSDVYGLGVILCEMLTGRRHFQGTVPQICAQILNVGMVGPSVVNTNIDSRLDAICLRATCRDTTQRFKSAAEFATALGQYLGEVVSDSVGVETSTSGYPDLQVPPSTGVSFRSIKRSPLTPVVLGGAAIAIAIPALILIGLTYNELAKSEIETVKDEVFVDTRKLQLPDIAFDLLQTPGPGSAASASIGTSLSVAAQTSDTAESSAKSMADSPLNEGDQESLKHVPMGTALFNISLRDNGAIYVIDGSEYRLVDIDKSVQLPAGDHRLEVMLAGRQLFSATFTIIPNQSQVVEVIDTSRSSNQRVTTNPYLNRSISESNVWFLQLHGTGKAELSWEQDAAHILTTSLSNEAIWHVQCLSPPLSLEEGRWYCLEVTARSPQKVRVSLTVSAAQLPYHHVGLSNEIFQLSNEYQTYSFLFQAKKVIPKQSRINLHASHDLGDVYIESIWIKEDDSTAPDPADVTKQGAGGLKPDSGS